MEIVSQPQNITSGAFLNTREISILIWITIFFIWTIQFQPIRQSIKEFLKGLLSSIILKVFLIMFIYIFFEVLIIFKLNLWIDILIKDLFLWITGTGIALAMKINKAKDLGFFTKIVKDNIKFTLVLEFIIQNYTFSMIFELVFVPVLVIIIALNAYAKTNQKHERFVKFFGYLLAIIGIVDLSYVIINILSDPTSIFNNTNLLEFTFPIYLTLLFIPFLYFLSIFMRYDELIGKHGRVTFMLEKKNGKNIKYIRRKIVSYCNFNLKKWNDFNLHYANKLYDIDSVSEIDQLFDSISN